jgi:hypothetical protein
LVLHILDLTSILCDKLLYSQGPIAGCARSYLRLKDVTSNFIITLRPRV